MPVIHEIATLTSKGQITLPKSIRQALGLARTMLEHAGHKVTLSDGFDEDVEI